MHRSALAMLFAGLLLGCGGDEESLSAEDRLQGKWGTLSGVNECGTFFGFDDATVEVLIVCELDDGSFGAPSTSGTFVVKEGSFTWTAKASSCPRSAVTTETVAYAFVGEQLRLTVPEGALLLERANSNGASGGGAVAYGCFDQNGTFTSRAIQRW